MPTSNDPADYSDYNLYRVRHTFSESSAAGLSRQVISITSLGLHHNVNTAMGHDVIITAW